jgi:hypothetical protein
MIGRLKSTAELRFAVRQRLAARDPQQASRPEVENTPLPASQRGNPELAVVAYLIQPVVRGVGER